MHSVILQSHWREHIGWEWYKRRSFNNNTCKRVRICWTGYFRLWQVWHRQKCRNYVTVTFSYYSAYWDWPIKDFRHRPIFQNATAALYRCPLHFYSSGLKRQIRWGWHCGCGRCRCKLAGVDWRVPSRSHCKIPHGTHPANPDSFHAGHARVCWLGGAVDWSGGVFASCITRWPLIASRAVVYAMF